MSNARKPLIVNQLEDLTLGVFSNLRPSETLDHLVRYLSTWNGSDKLFMLIQYAVKVLVPILQARARLQHRVGLRKEPTSSLTPKLTKLANIISDARTLWGIWGMLPIVQWLISLERSPPPTRRLLTIERTQGWSMLVFYPLQHFSYLRTHELIPAALPLPSLSGKPRRVTINEPAVSLCSTRLWAAYVVLQLAHLREDRTLLLKRQRALNRLSPREKLQPEERAELARRWDSWYSELALNLSYLPMTIHWSLEKGLFKNDVWISLFGLAAAIASFRSGWNATVLPPSSPPAEPSSFLEPEAEGPSTVSDNSQGLATDTGYNTQ